MTELLTHPGSLVAVLSVLFVVGFVPGAVLRIVVKAFRCDDPRRHELLAELHVVPFAKRPLWVVSQFEVAFSEGLLERIRDFVLRSRASRRTNHESVDDQQPPTYTAELVDRGHGQDALTVAKQPAGTASISLVGGMSSKRNGSTVTMNGESNLTIG